MAVIKTEEFILRPIKMSDASGYWQTMQDTDTVCGFRSVPNNFEEAEKEIKDHIEKSKRGITEVFTIEIDCKYAGNVKLDVQNYDKNNDEGRVHIWLHPAFRGKGIATKALSKVVEYGFKKKKYRVIYAQTKVTNEAVSRVMEKVGFTMEKIHIVDGVEKKWWSIKPK